MACRLPESRHHELKTVMWGSVVGGLIGAVVGAVVGGAVTYYRERRLEAERKHEETVEKLYHKVAELSEAVSALVSGAGFFGRDLPYPEEARDLALEAEELATGLTDEDLKREVIRTMNREYESPEEICWQLEQIELALRKRAYPTLYDIKEEGRTAPSGLAAVKAGQEEEDWSTGWRGPAKIHFLIRLRERGQVLRVEDEN